MEQELELSAVIGFQGKPLLTYSVHYWQAVVLITFLKNQS